MTENEPARLPSGTAGTSRTGNAVARRGDLVVIHLRHRDWRDGQPRDYDDFWLGQVTSVTRAGLVRLYRPAGDFSWETDGRGRSCRGQPLPSLWFERAAIKTQAEIDVRCLATAACHVWPGHEDHVRGYATLRKSGPRCDLTCWNPPGGNGCATPPEPGRPPGGKPARC